VLDARLLQHLAQQPLGQRLDLGGEAPPARLVALERLALTLVVRDIAFEVRAVVVALRVLTLLRHEPSPHEVLGLVRARLRVRVRVRARVGARVRVRVS